MSLPSEPAPPELSVVIPAYNEEQRIAIALAGVRDYARRHSIRCELIVVDDGSSDGTADRVNSFDMQPVTVQVLVNSKNLGKGASVSRGMMVATGDAILMTDADLSTPMDELDKMMPWLDHDYDVVIASRDMPDSVLDPPQPLSRRLLAWTFRTIRRCVLLSHIRDTQCGFKLFTRAAAHDAFAVQTIPGWTFDIEVLGLADRLGYLIKEVGVYWADHPHSRVRPHVVALQTLFNLLTIRWHLHRVMRREGLEHGMRKSDQGGDQRPETGDRRPGT